MSASNLPTPEGFVEAYGLDASVALNGMQLTLGQALAAEAAFCPADVAVSHDPARRISFLATILNAGGSLRPEDEHFLPRQA